MTLLFYSALYLAARKVIDDLDAFTEASSRRTDLLAFAVIAVVMFVLAGAA